MKAKTTPRTYDEWVRLKSGPIPVAIYDRHSSDMQDESTADNRQQSCKEYAEKHGMAVVAVYSDYSKSGQTTAGRGGYLALLAEALSPRPKFAGVLVYHSFRWGRGEDSKYDFLTIRRKGLNVISVTEPLFQDEGPEGIFARDVILAAGAYQAQQHGRYTHGLQQRNAVNGFLNGGRALDGYIKVPVPLGIRNKRGEERCRYRLELDQRPGQNDRTGLPRWRWVRDAVDMALKRQMGLRAIAQELMAQGWRQGTKNRPLGPSHVRSALTNPVYSGFMAWNRRKWRKVDGRRRSALNPPEAWIWSSQPSHPAVMTRQEFEEMAKRFSLVPTRTGHARRQLLAGLLECAECGSHFVISSRTKKDHEYLYLICGRKQRLGWKNCPMPAIPLYDVEDAVEAVLLDRLLNPALIEEFLTGFNAWLTQESRGNRKLLAERGAEAGRLEREVGNLVAALASAAGSSPTVLGEIQKREERLATLRLDIAAAGAASPAKAPRLNLEGADLNRWAETARGVYLAMGRDGRRAVLRHLIKKIVVLKNKEGRIIYDPASLFDLQRAFPGLPVEERLCLGDGCGGWI